MPDATCVTQRNRTLMLALVVAWVGLATGCDDGPASTDSKRDAAPLRPSPAVPPVTPKASVAELKEHQPEAKIPPPSVIPSLPAAPVTPVAPVAPVAPETSQPETPSPETPPEVTRLPQAPLAADPTPPEIPETTTERAVSTADLLPGQESASGLMESLVEGGWRAVPSSDGSILLLPPGADEPAE